MNDINNKIIEAVVRYNSRDKNIMKVIEECAELTEVLAKCITKQPEDRPKREKIVEEAGDVIFRIKVLSKMLDIEQQIEERVQFKHNQLKDWIEEKYEGVV